MDNITQCLKNHSLKFDKINFDSELKIKKLPESKLEKIKETSIMTYKQKEIFVSFAYHFKKTAGLLRVDLIDVSDIIKIYNDCFKETPLPDFDIMKFLKSHTTRDGVLIREYEELLKNFVNKNLSEYSTRDTRRSAVVKGQMTSNSLMLSKFRTENLLGEEF